MNGFRWSSSLVVVALLSGLSAAMGQTADPLTARIVEAEATESLDTPDLKPWHVKLAVRRFDEQGKPTDQGTIEEFWGSPEKRKVLYDFPSLKGTELVADGKTYRSAGMEGIPLPLRQLLELWVHPIDLIEINDTKPELKKQKFGKVSLDCVVLGKKMEGMREPPFGFYPTFCFEPGKSDVRIAFFPGTEAFVRNGSGKFQGREVTTDFSLEQASVKIATARLTSLTTFPVGDADFALSPDLQAATARPVPVGAGVVAAMNLFRGRPVYPIEAKQRGTQGVVVLKAIIERDGSVGSLHPVGKFDLVLAHAAMEAVKQWKYRPYLLNGEPTQIETTISVTFSMGRPM